MRDPPIATALIGAGMLSLWRTTPVFVDDQDYLGTAQQRFGEQVTEAADAVKEYAAESVALLAKKSAPMRSPPGKRAAVLVRWDTRLAKRLDPHEALNYAGAVLIPIGFFIVWLIFRENCRSR